MKKWELDVSKKIYRGAKNILHFFATDFRLATTLPRKARTRLVHDVPQSACVKGKKTHLDNLTEWGRKMELVMPDTVKSESAAENQASRPLEIRIASTIEEYEAAFRIAYDVYFPLGFTDYSPAGIRVAAAQLRPGTAVLLAYYEGQPIATMSVYGDTEGGLPSSSGWPNEIGRLREEGRKMFEFGALMVLPGRAYLGMRLCLEIFRFAWQYVWDVKKGDTLCAFVQSKHAWYYQRILTFQQFGEPQTYQWNGLRIADVVPMFLDLVGREESWMKIYGRFGESRRNLHKFFCSLERREREQFIRSELRRKNRMDFQELCRRYGGCCNSQVKSNQELNQKKAV